MAQYRYLGTKSVIVTPDRNHTIEVFGQVIELPQELAEQMVRDRAPLLPDYLWGTLGISEDELNEFPSVLAHDLAPSAFIARRDAAWKALHQYRSELNAPVAPVLPVAPVAPAEPQPAASVVTAAPVADQEATS